MLALLIQLSNNQHIFPNLKPKREKKEEEKMREKNIISLKIVQRLDSTELKVIRTARLIRRNLWDKVSLNITYRS